MPKVNYDLNRYAKVKRFTVDIPLPLYKRALVLMQTERITAAQLVRAAFIERVKAFEEDQRKQAELREAELARKRAKRKGPSPALSAPDPHAQKRDRLEPIYEQQAKIIIGAGDDKDKARHLAEIAVAFVKKTAPLTHPSDTEIIARLEATILRLRSTEKPPARSYDDFVGAVISTPLHTLDDYEE